MRMLSTLKARFPKLFPVLTAVVALGTVGGIAAYERMGSDSCCAPGASCCYPGSPCCAGHKHAAK